MTILNFELDDIQGIDVNLRHNQISLNLEVTRHLFNRGGILKRTVSSEGWSGWEYDGENIYEVNVIEAGHKEHSYVARTKYLHRDRISEEEFVNQLQIHIEDNGLVFPVLMR